MQVHSAAWHPLPKVIADGGGGFVGCKGEAFVGPLCFDLKGFPVHTAVEKSEGRFLQGLDRTVIGFYSIAEGNRPKNMLYPGQNRINVYVTRCVFNEKPPLFADNSYVAAVQIAYAGTNVVHDLPFIVTAIALSEGDLTVFYE
jgi:hypothetical protein